VWDRTALPATRHKWIHPTLIPARLASTGFTYTMTMEGWVDLDLSDTAVVSHRCNHWHQRVTCECRNITKNVKVAICCTLYVLSPTAKWHGRLWCFVAESVVEKRAAVVDVVAQAPKTVSSTENIYCPGFFPIPPVAAVCIASIQYYFLCSCLLAIWHNMNL